MGVYFRGRYFPWGFTSYLKLIGGLFPRPDSYYSLQDHMKKICIVLSDISATSIPLRAEWLQV